MVCNLSRIDDPSICIFECNFRINEVKDNKLFSTGQKLFFNVVYSFPFFFCSIRGFGLSLYRL